LPSVAPPSDVLRCGPTDVAARRSPDDAVGLATRGGDDTGDTGERAVAVAAAPTSSDDLRLEEGGELKARGLSFSDDPVRRDDDDVAVAER
jgi:hypothetical protein